ncbi:MULTISPECIES: 3-phenylpropionate/cinnamic acid dioxygenase subunit beta [Rhodobacterales]|mgnify:FL=1|jgi:3-phenylpropionate/cinnamic acid dioxygenase small subunit|uniref:3-phenylpropionate/cinnamic acid dioxygenase subunit beta n=1 Tax=Sulfitobacter porphyrae TaxID=1246864 RepID=A0ABW2BCA9_9RHOB|nr:3-phenylpropionate/cinnamic acid dioxygenase subunit beta [Shimia aestuarii]GLT12244.1 3-phenylpropionate dioxygenase [Sulfitobacter porphyrae]|tara:strand:+ start:653 stop:1222 length:570 start_codon:yes stop_codon:yes gene_type:complete
MDNVAISSPTLDRNDAYFRLRGEVEELFYDEASMLDERRFDEWLELMHEDVVYFMPMRRNVKFGMHDERENTRVDEGISWFNEDKWTLRKRVEQILTGVHYAEEPLSRIAHLITNVQIRSTVPEIENASEIRTSCRFHVYQNRVEHEHYSFVGRRYDTLVRVNGALKIRERKIILDQNVLLAKCLTAFF